MCGVSGSGVGPCAAVHRCGGRVGPGARRLLHPLLGSPAAALASTQATCFRHRTTTLFIYCQLNIVPSVLRQSLQGSLSWRHRYVAKLDRFYAIGGGPAAAAAVGSTSAASSLAQQDLRAERIKLGQEVAKMESLKSNKIRQRWQPGSGEYTRAQSELKAYSLRRQQDAAEALVCLVASQRDRLHRLDATNRHERLKLRTKLGVAMDRLTTTLQEVRRWLLAPGDFSTPGWGVAGVDAAIAQVATQRGRNRDDAVGGAEAGGAGASGEGEPAVTDAAYGLIQLPWLENPVALWHVDEPADLKQLYLRCCEELELLVRESADMVERYEHSVRGLQGVRSELEEHLRALNAAVVKWTERVFAPVPTRDQEGLCPQQVRMLSACRGEDIAGRAVVHTRRTEAQHGGRGKDRCAVCSCPPVRWVWRLAGASASALLCSRSTPCHVVAGGCCH
jgi:hypothetical protein